MNIGAVNARRILNVWSSAVTRISPALIAKVSKSNALCPLVVSKAAGAIQPLRALQDVHPVQAAIVVLAIENRIERLMVESFFGERHAILSSKKENQILQEITCSV
jgi:hypothetical protein